MTIKILASGSALPNKVVSNSDLTQFIATSDEWIKTNIGVSHRHILDQSESFIDYVAIAAKQALLTADVNPKQIDLIIIGTTTPAQIMPSTASILQGILGIPEAIAFDLQAACSGFIYALVSAYALMKIVGQLRYALVIGCDAFSKIVNWQDRATCTIFGDGFGCVLLSCHKGSKKQGILYTELGSDGLGKNTLQVPWGVAQGLNSLTDNSKLFFLTMNGHVVFKKAIQRFCQQITKVLVTNKITIDDLVYIIPHQANIRILKEVANKLMIPFEKFAITLHEHGNTSAASIPLAFDKFIKEGKIKPGDLILFIGFGAGFTWGNVLFRF